MKANRIIAVILCAALCFCMAFSALFIAIEADHDCANEHCSVCLQIETCVSLLSGSGFAVVCFFALFFAKRLMSGYARLKRFSVKKEASPVLSKVKLTN